MEHYILYLIIIWPVSFGLYHLLNEVMGGKQTSVIEKVKRFSFSLIGVSTIGLYGASMLYLLVNHNKVTLAFMLFMILLLCLFCSLISIWLYKQVFNQNKLSYNLWCFMLNIFGALSMFMLIAYHGLITRS